MPLRKFTTQFCTVKLKEKEKKNEAKKGERKSRERQPKAEREGGRQTRVISVI